MINKLKYLFLLVLCVGLVGGLTNISAQNSSDRVLIAGKKSLRQSEVNKLIQFYEWAFEAKFNDDQREKFLEYTQEEFRNNPDLSRSTIDDIVSTLPKILAASNDVQQETRKNFLQVFLEEARKNSDENSKMLIGIYEDAHNENQTNTTSNSSNTDSTESNDSSVQSIGDVSQLVGEWVWGRSGSSTYTTGGAYMGSNGSRHTYQFSPNGTVVYTGIMNVMTGGCNMQIFKTAKGRASLNGNTLTINWAPASFSRDDSCSPSKNYKKTLPAESETYKISFKDSYGQKQLCMTAKDETCFSKK